MLSHGNSIGRKKAFTFFQVYLLRTRFLSVLHTPVPLSVTISTEWARALLPDDPNVACNLFILSSWILCKPDFFFAVAIQAHSQLECDGISPVCYRSAPTALPHVSIESPHLQYPSLSTFSKIVLSFLFTGLSIQFYITELLPTSMLVALPIGITLVTIM